MKTEKLKAEIEAAFKLFPYKIKKPAILFLNKKRFSRYLGDMQLEKHVDYTPCFVAHLPDGECICYCINVIKKFIDKKPSFFSRLFVRAITLHELYHVYNRRHNKKDLGSVKGALSSELSVHKEIRKDFPEVAKVLDFIEAENKRRLQRV